MLDRVGGWTLGFGRDLIAKRAETAKTAPAANGLRVEPGFGNPASASALALALSSPPKEKKKKKAPGWFPDNQLALPIGSGEKGSDVPQFMGDPLPPLSILDPPRPSVQGYTPEDLERISREVEGHLNDFGVEAGYC